MRGRPGGQAGHRPAGRGIQTTVNRPVSGLLLKARGFRRSSGWESRVPPLARPMTSAVEARRPGFMFSTCTLPEVR